MGIISSFAVTMKHFFCSNISILRRYFIIFMMTSFAYGQVKIVAIEPSSAVPGELVKIYGVGLASSDIPANTITFGGQEAVVTYANTKQLTVIVPEGNYGLNVIEVTVNDTYSDSYFPFTILSELYGDMTFSAPIPFDDAAGGMIDVADMDGDLDLDIVIGQSEEIGWLENLDGKGSFGDAQMFYHYNKNFNFISCADIDNDGDNDIVAMANLITSYGGYIGWIENINGSLNTFHSIEYQSTYGTRIV